MIDERSAGYIRDRFVHEDPILRATREGQAAAGLPDIAVSPEEGRILELLLRAIGARRVLEIGTLGGYSALWMARALPDDGELLSLEAEPVHAAYARRAIAAAGLDGVVSIKEGDARDLLPSLDPPFDAVFVDANKDAMPFYFGEALRLLRVGGLLLGDNALWDGKVADQTVDDEDTRGMRRFNALAAADPRVAATILPVRDGLLVGIKTRD